MASLRTVEVLYHMPSNSVDDESDLLSKTIDEWMKQRNVQWFGEGSFDGENPYNMSLMYTQGPLDDPQSVPLELANEIVAAFNSSEHATLGVARVYDLFLGDD